MLASKSHDHWNLFVPFSQLLPSWACAIDVPSKAKKKKARVIVIELGRSIFKVEVIAKIITRTSSPNWNSVTDVVKFTLR